MLHHVELDGFGFLFQALGFGAQGFACSVKALALNPKPWTKCLKL